MSISGPLAAPRLFFSGLCSLFPWAGFSKRGTHPRCVKLAGARSGPEGRGKGRARGGRFVYQRKHYVISGAVGPRPNLQAPRSSYTSLEQSGVESCGEADGKEKLEMQVFPPGDSCKMC